MAYNGMRGVDIAHYQSGLTMAELQRAKVGFAFVKATQRTDYTDPMFNTFFTRIKNQNSIIPGAYHFLEQASTGGSGKRQASHFVLTVGRANGGTTVGALCALDDEAYTRSWDKKRTNPQWSDVKSFMLEFWRITNNQTLFVYTTQSRFSRYRLDDPDVAGKPLKLWLANWYDNSPGMLATRPHGIPASAWTKRYNGKKAVVIQYASNTRVPSTGRIDADWTMKTRSELLKFTTRVGVKPIDDSNTKPKPSTPTDIEDVWEEEWLEGDNADDTAAASGATMTAGIAGIAGLGIAALVAASVVGLAVIGAQRKGVNKALE